MRRTPTRSRTTPPVRHRRRRLVAAAAGVALLGAAGVTPLVVGDAQAAQRPAAAPRAAVPYVGHRADDVQANLFEWNWPSVARECTDVLGPKGYGGVQVSPPADSISRTEPSPDAPLLHPWWEVYQPVDYDLTSRFGDEAQFRAMVSTCRRAGVKVYVDAVINHMTGQGTVSYGGRTFTHLDYPGLYTAADFHRPPADCPTGGGIDDFNDYRQVTHCELLGLADLRTESPAVQTKIAAYLNELISYGVSGFRVDAAKHIGEDDLIALQKRLRRTLDGDRPYVALEVFPGGPGTLSQRAFTRAGDVLGFDFAYQIKNAFKSYPAGATGNIAGLSVFGEDAGLVPSGTSLVFIENHDTERGSDTLSYKDGATNTIANEFMLAYGYGTPQVYSGFAFTNSYDSPPADAAGFVSDADCSGAYVCVDRDPGVTGMVGFHNYVGSVAVRHWYDDGQNLIAFSRGNRGFFSTNNATTPSTVTVQTGLGRGVYCDVVHGARTGSSCSGPSVTVGNDGRATVTVGAKDSVAFTAVTRIH